MTMKINYLFALFFSLTYIFVSAQKINLQTDKTKFIIKEQKLADNLEDAEALFKAMSRYPKIIERPIVVKDELAVIGRPPENILVLLD